MTAERKGTTTGTDEILIPRFLAYAYTHTIAYHQVWRQVQAFFAELRYRLRKYPPTGSLIHLREYH
jgi:hypothetical protein